jgi:DNA-directed RNA polymerase specialized sigma24 family protein
VRGAGLEHIEALSRSRYARFLRVATAITADEHLAADAVHDGFVRAVRYRRRCRGSLDGWYGRSSSASALKARRDAPLEPARLSNGDEPDGEVRALVAALPERQRIALFLRCYADLDYAAIAAEMLTTRALGSPFRAAAAAESARSLRCESSRGCYLGATASK